MSVRTRTIGCGLLAAVIMISLEPGSTLAEESTGPKTASSLWNFEISPYIWVAGIDGQIASFGPPTVEVDADSEDLRGDAELSLVAVGEVRYGRFGLFADLTYVNIKTDAQSSPEAPFSSGEADWDSFFFTPMLEYRLIEDDGLRLDAMAGARIAHAEPKIRFDGGLLDGQKRTDAETWVDPTVGLRGRLAFAESWGLDGWGIIGGFGVSSQFMWDVLGTVNYDVADWFSIEIGYRGSGTDYGIDGFFLDSVIHGPIIGGVFAL